jgi:hypothetical protein
MANGIIAKEMLIRFMAYKKNVALYSDSGKLD